MAQGTILKPSGYSNYADITTSWVTQSNYHRVNDSKVEWSRSGNVVIVTVTVGCDTPYTDYPGMTVATGFPLPQALIVENFPAFGTADANTPLWVRVESNGDLHFRYGTAAKSYNVSLIYICK